MHCQQRSCSYKTSDRHNPLGIVAVAFCGESKENSPFSENNRGIILQSREECVLLHRNREISVAEIAQLVERRIRNA